MAETTWTYSVTTREASSCDSNSERLICRCLRITEQAVVTAIVSSRLSTLHEVRRCTGAGDGCTACHARLKCLLRQHVPSVAGSCAE
jgi:NAD(P)H-nitrite reductase large subunit